MDQALGRNIMADCTVEEYPEAGNVFEEAWEIF